MEETIKLNINWINKQYKEMKSVEQIIVEEVNNYNGKKAKKIQEICRDFKIAFRRIAIIKEKASHYEAQSTVIPIIDELNAYAQIAKQILTKIQKLGILPGNI